MPTTDPDLPHWSEGQLGPSRKSWVHPSKNGLLTYESMGFVRVSPPPFLWFYKGLRSSAWPCACAGFAAGLSIAAAISLLWFLSAQALVRTHGWWVVFALLFAFPGSAIAYEGTHAAMALRHVARARRRGWYVDPGGRVHQAIRELGSLSLPRDTTIEIARSLATMMPVSYVPNSQPD